MELAHRLTSQRLTKPVKGWLPNTLKEHLQQHTSNPTTWKHVLHLMPTWARNPATAPPDLPQLPTNAAVIHRAVKGTTSDDIILLLDEIVQVQATPGKRVSVHFKNHDQPYLLLEKTDTGTLDLSHKDRIPHPLTLPQIEGSRADIMVQHWLKSPILQTARTAVISTYLQNRWYTIDRGIHIKPNSRQTATLINRIVHQRAGPIMSPTDARKTCIPLTEAVRTLLHPETWERAHNQGTPVATFTYNLSHTLGQDLCHLAETNPGAVAWVLAYNHTQNTLDHPGQFITMAKNMLHAAGLEPANWKYAATMDSSHMKNLTQHPSNPTEVALLLNAMAQARATPTENTSREILRSILPLGFYHPATTAPTHPRRYNVTRMIMLLCRESARLQATNGEHRQRLLTQSAREVLDYILHIFGQHEPTTIRASTWNGLLKASNRWHETIQRHPALPARQKPAYQSWTSLVGPLTYGPYTIVPLTDSTQLEEESQIMKNCVSGYTYRCTSGHSRIFSLQKQDRRIATGQITILANGWKESQTKG